MADGHTRGCVYLDNSYSLVRDGGFGEIQAKPVPCSGHAPSAPSASRARPAFATAVDVTAESLYEAAALGLALLRKDGWIEGLAERLGSSQSRVAKIEAGDPSVSLDLLTRSMLALGATKNDIARALRG